MNAELVEGRLRPGFQISGHGRRDPPEGVLVTVGRFANLVSTSKNFFFFAADITVK